MEQLEFLFYPQLEIQSTDQCPLCKKLIASNEVIMYYMACSDSSEPGRQYCVHSRLEDIK